MLDRIEISNFLAFRYLKIDNIKRVNLITGKNNTGKTALLEAIRAYRSRFSSYVISDILNNRGFRLSDYEDLFGLFNTVETSRSPVELFINEFKLKSNSDLRQAIELFESDEAIANLSLLNHHDYPDKNLVYLSFGFDEDRLEDQWSKIALTPTEDDVFSIIKNSIQENFLKLNVTSKEVLIRLEGEERPVNIRKLGDGMKRIVSIAMALATSKGKVLLIDEIETGLHHTVLSKLWEIIFEYSLKWDIQVFATTHSNDAITTFRNEAARTDEQKRMSRIVRLQKSRVNGDIEAVLYDYKKLDLLLDSDVEIR